MTEKPWFKHLTEIERGQLSVHEEAIKKLRDDAGMHSRWKKQIIDRASHRMRAQERK